LEEGTNRKTNSKRRVVVWVFFVVVLTGSAWTSGSYDGGDGSEGAAFEINTAVQMGRGGKLSGFFGSYGVFLVIADYGEGGGKRSSWP
jgi:hypothetical protein